MDNLHEFHQRKMVLLREYEILKTSDILPVSYQGVEINRSSIEQDIDSLQKEQFVISICGQVNAGKSTILNAMLFDREILPNSVTPETAKLTFMSWGETPSFQAVFYSMDEWDSFKSVDRENYFEKYLAPMLAKIEARFGEVFPEKEVGRDKYVSNELEELREYVGAEGRYTPFVKECHIYYPSKLLKEVTVVDTPGTNDPNHIRTEITEKWIAQSDAVIFVMFGGQSLSDEDNRFIDKFLFPLRPDKVLVVLSKLDTVKDKNKVRQYVENGLSGLGGFCKQIATQKIYAVSAICRLYPKLLSLHETGEIQLDSEQLEDINHQLVTRKAATEPLVKVEGYLPELIAAVDERLMKDKGVSLLASRRKKIISVYEFGYRNKKSKLGRLEKDLELLSNSAEENAEKLKAFASSKVELQNILNEWKNDVKALRAALNSYLSKECINFLANVKCEGEKAINNIDVHYLQKNLCWDLKGIFFKDFSKLAEKIEERYKDHNDNLKDIKIKMQETLNKMNVFIPDMIDELLFAPDYWRIGHVVEEEIMEQLSEKTLSTLREWQYLPVFADDEKTKSNYKARLKELCDSQDKLAMVLENVLKPELDKVSQFAEKVAISLSEELIEVEKKLREVQEGNDSRIKAKEQIEKECEEVKKEMVELEKVVQGVRTRMSW